MQTAKNTLEAISADPNAQSLAREREMGMRVHEHLMHMARAEGEARGEAKAVLTFLEARGLTPNEEQRRRILACTELEQLNTWVRKAVTLIDVNELFTH
jgi:hypothetical protein